MPCSADVATSWVRNHPVPLSRARQGSPYPAEESAASARSGPDRSPLAPALVPAATNRRPSSARAFRIADVPVPSLLENPLEEDDEDEQDQVDGPDAAVAASAPVAEFTRSSSSYSRSVVPGAASVPDLAAETLELASELATSRRHSRSVDFRMDALQEESPFTQSVISEMSAFQFEALQARVSESSAKVAKVSRERNALRDALTRARRRSDVRSEETDKELAKVSNERDELREQLKSTQKYCGVRAKECDRLRRKLAEALAWRNGAEHYREELHSKVFAASPPVDGPSPPAGDHISEEAQRTVTVQSMPVQVFAAVPVEEPSPSLVERSSGETGRAVTVLAATEETQVIFECAPASLGSQPVRLSANQAVCAGPSVQTLMHSQGFPRDEKASPVPSAAVGLPLPAAARRPRMGVLAPKEREEAAKRMMAA